MKYNKFKKLMAISNLMVRNGGSSKAVDEFFKSNGVNLPIGMLNDFMEESLTKKIDMECLEEK